MQTGDVDPNVKGEGYEMYASLEHVDRVGLAGSQAAYVHRYGKTETSNRPVGDPSQAVAQTVSRTTSPQASSLEFEGITRPIANTRGSLVAACHRCPQGTKDWFRLQEGAVRSLDHTKKREWILSVGRPPENPRQPLFADRRSNGAQLRQAERAAQFAALQEYLAKRKP